MELLCKKKIKKVYEDNVEIFEDLVVIEHELTMFLNGAKSTCFYCSPQNLVELIIGSLYVNCQIHAVSDITKIEFSFDQSSVHVETKPFVDNKPNFNADKKDQVLEKLTDSIGYDNNGLIRNKSIIYNAKHIINLSTQFTTISDAFQSTGGIHSVGICDNEKILIYYEDIGRHNAMDKAIGHALRTNLDMNNFFLLTSGRIPLEIVKKVCNTPFPLLVSRSAPTDMGILHATKNNLQLVGFSRQGRFNIYHDEGLIKLPNAK